MKTNMEKALGALLVLVLLAFAWRQYNAMQLDVAYADVTVTEAGQAIPSGVKEFGEYGFSLMVNIAIGAVCTGFGAVLARKAWDEYRKRNQQNSRQFPATAPRQPSMRTPNDAELYKMMLYQQMMQQSGGRRPAPMPQIGRDNDDETDVLF